MFRRVLVIAGSVIVGLATVVAALPWFGIEGSGEFGDVFWPAVALPLLGVTLVAGVVLIVLRRRGDRTQAMQAPQIDSSGPSDEQWTIDPSDQQRLDELFHVLNRDSIRRVKWEDFYIAWPATLTNPAVVYVQELTDIEHTFHDPVLEDLRKDLSEKAATFAQTEAWTAIDHPRLQTKRYSGVSQGEADGDPEKFQQLRESADKIQLAATEFTAAHDKLVKAAMERGYNLDALSRDRHLQVERLDEIYDPETWADVHAAASTGRADQGAG